MKTNNKTHTHTHTQTQNEVKYSNIIGQSYTHKNNHRQALKHKLISITEKCRDACTNAGTHARTHARMDAWTHEWTQAPTNTLTRKETDRRQTHIK